jgi:hypothetical protein
MAKNASIIYDIPHGKLGRTYEESLRGGIGQRNAKEKNF